MLVASTSVFGFNCTTPAASSSRTPPSRPRASPCSRAWVWGPHEMPKGQRPQPRRTYRPPPANNMKTTSNEQNQQSADTS